jgi:hypothetical protein
VALPYSHTWTGTNGAAWSGDWTTSTSSGGTVDIQSNAGRMLCGSIGGYGDWCRALLADQGDADFDLTVDLIPQVQDEHYPVLSFRTDRTWSAGSSGPCWATNGYGIEIQIDSDGTGYWNIDRVDAGTRTDIATSSYAANSGDSIHLNVRCDGTSVEFRIWKNAESKPGTATHSFTDSTHNTRTGHGLATNGGAGTLDEDRWDNLAIDPIAGDLTLNPASDITTTGWATQTGATTNLYQVIDEDSASDTDYVASEPASTSALEVGLQSGTDPASSSGHVVHYRYRKQGTPAADLTVSLREGASTEIASWAHTGISTSWTQADQTLTGTQADSITDYTALRLRFAPTTATSAPSKVSDRGSTQNITSQGSTTVSLTGNTTVGNVMIARVAVDNSGTNGARPGLTVADDRSNTWTVVQGGLADPGAANAGSAVYIAYCRVDTQLVTSDLVTFTWGTAATAKAIVLEEWSGVHAATPLAPITPVTNSGSGTAMTVGPIAPTAANQMVYTALSTEGPTGDTAPSDSDTTNGSWVSLTRLSTGSGTAASNQTVAGQYKLVTASGNQTWDATITNRDWAAVAVVFHGGSSAQVSWANLQLDGAPEVTGTAATSLTFSATATGLVTHPGATVTALAFTATAAGTRTTAGTAAASLAFSAPAVGVPTTPGTAATDLTFNAPAAGMVTGPSVTGTATTDLMFSATAVGLVTVPATAATTLAFAAPAVGTPTTPGTAASSFTFAAPAAGTVTAGGGTPVLYSDGTGFLYSDATEVLYAGGGASALADFTFSATGSGTVTRAGAAATSLSFTASAVGTKSVLATAATDLTFAAPAVGTVAAEEVTGTAATALAFAASASGTVEHAGTATTSLSFAAPAVGTVTAEEVTGAAATDLVFAAPTAATVEHPATAATALAFAAPAVGAVTVTATATTAVTFAAPAVATRTALGAAETTLSFAAPAAGSSFAPGSGLASADLTFTATAAGTVTRSGTAATNVTFDAPAQGVPTTSGTAATSLAFTAPASGTVVHPATATTDLVFTTTAVGEGAAVAGGTAATDLTFNASAAGTVTHSAAAVTALAFAAVAAGTVTHHAQATTILELAATAVGTIVGEVDGTATTTLAFAAPVTVGVPDILAERTSSRRPANHTSARRQMSSV